jgi:ATP-dependent protease ClpP protease subunit
MTTQTHAIPHTAYLFAGSIATGEPLTDLTSFITRFQEINVGNSRTLLLRVHSSGGYPEQVFALCGLIRQVQAEGHKVIVHILGQLCNFTIVLAMVADEVWMEPTSSLAFEQMDLECTGTTRSIRSYFRHQNQMFDNLVTEMVNRSAAKRPESKLEESTIRRWKAKLITAQQAETWGLCDKVLEFPKPLPRGTLSPKNMQFNLTFANDKANNGVLIWLHTWLADDSNAGIPLRLNLTSNGGTVSQALALYGLLLEAQRQGHHLIVHSLGEIYSCALWLPTCALHAGTVFIDRMARAMYHPPQTTVKGRQDHLEERLTVQDEIFRGTRQLLIGMTRFTDDLLDQLEGDPDHYMTAQELVDRGLGQLV